MKAKELIRMLQKVNPEATVVNVYEDGDEVMWANPVTDKGLPGVVVLETKESGTWGAELQAMLDHFEKENVPHKERYEKLLGIGVTPEMLNRYLGEKESDKMRRNIESPKEFDICLLEKEGIDGLSKEEALTLMDHLRSDQFYPLEIAAAEHESSAMGFITKDAAIYLDFIFDYVVKKVQAILDDMAKESSDGEYGLGLLSIFMSRNIEDL